MYKHAGHVTHVKDTDSQLAIIKFSMNTIIIGPANVLADQHAILHSTSGAYELTSHLNAYGGDYTSATSQVTMKLSLVHKTHFFDKA